MKSARWKQIEQLYHSALRLDSERRAAFLQEACAGDEALRHEVESLLAHQPEASSFIEAPALEQAAEMLAQTPAHSTQILHSVPHSHPLVGQTVSHYRIVEKLGEGGMGVVYKAHDLKLERSVALKFLPLHVTPDAEEKERFFREAKAASALDHPNIGTIHEIAETTDGRMFIVMAYYEGETLKQKIEHGPLPVNEALDIAVQMARGLAKAHDRQIVHRDIKPANVIVTREGVVKVIDFGLAKLGGLTKITKTHTTMGTVAYMSPEQARGEEVDQRADVWSLGVVLYEMLSGQVPFPGNHAEAIIHAIVTAKPKPLKQLAPGVPAEMERIISRALEKDLKSRYSSAAEVLKHLMEYQSSLISIPARLSRSSVVVGWIKQKRVVVPGILLLLVIGSLLGWYFHRQAKVRWARGELLPRIDQLIENGWENYVEAHKLAVEAEKYLPHDPKLSGFLSKIAFSISIKTEPAGASIFMKEYTAPESEEWKFLGISPIEKMRLPVGIFRWKMEKEGYETVLAASPNFLFGGSLIPHNIFRVLDKKGTIPTGMVRVQGEKEIGDFFVDQYEVSNKQFKEFIDKGGYRKREYWKEKFIKAGKELAWEQAIQEFLDQTGQPGPASWHVGEYPEGQADYPVSGVSWYEAAAYAEFVGKSLPTVSHWGIARGEYTSLVQDPLYFFVAPLSNFKGKGAAPVGSSPAITPYGAYDMAGNVREWCWNESPDGRIIRGGAWNDLTYMFQELSQALPFDRSSRNGFRCVSYLDPDKIPKSTFQLAKLPEAPDFYKLKPVSDSIFEVYKEQFSYDKTDLNAHVEWRSESSKDWVQEKVTFDAAYDNERVIAYLFLPRRGSPPYQTVIYFAGLPAVDQRSSKDLERDFYFDNHLSFIIKNGRAVLLPLYKGAFERGNDALTRTIEGGASPRQYTEVLIKDIKDFKRSIDYLETRPDIDSKRLAYTGFSWGAMNGAIIPAVEDRLKASVLYVGGLFAGARPEVEQMNYVTRVKIPTLMLSGKYDMVVPYETSTKPMFDLLGTPKEHKQQKLYDSDHFIPRNELIKETLNWLDRYLGPVK